MFDVSTEEVFQDGQIIFEEGNAGDWIYIIESGTVELYKMAGEEKVVIDVLNPGDIFGELSYIARIPRTLTARAVGETTLGILDRSFLDQEFNKLSGSFRMILVNLALRLERTTEKTSTPKLRRQDPRIPKILSLSFKSSEGFKKAFSGDMSSGGIFVKTQKPLPQGEEFVLKLQLPDTSEVLQIGCKVSWSRTETDDPVKRPPGMGIEFVEISPEDRQRLKKELIKGDSDIQPTRLKFKPL
ncbi:TIGR02266 family protein [Thermodesulfobacteriota bacterium]